MGLFFSSRCIKYVVKNEAFIEIWLKIINFTLQQHAQSPMATNSTQKQAARQFVKDWAGKGSVPVKEMRANSLTKWLFALLTFLCITVTSYSQVIINMEEDSGVYRIPCLVNGTKMKFVFDTGASAVCLSESMAEYLFDNDYISADDFVGRGQSSVADGRIVNNLHLIIRDIEIAGLHLRDVESIVIEGQKAPLLLGMTAISKLGRIELNGNQLIIHSAAEIADVESRVKSLLKKADSYMADELYTRAKNCYAEVDGLGQMEDIDRYHYAYCAMKTQDYKTAKRLVDQIPDRDGYGYFSGKGINFYAFIGWVYYNNDIDEDAAVFFKKAYESRYPHEPRDVKAKYLSLRADCLYNLKKYDDAANLYYTAYSEYAEYEGVSLEYVQRVYLDKLKKGEKHYRLLVHDTDGIEYNSYSWILSMYKAGHCGEEDYLYQLSMYAVNGNAYAIKKCREMNFKPEAHLRRYYGYRY